MKQIQISRRVWRGNSNKPHYGFVYVNCYKCYKEYGIAITESIDYKGYYELTDIETGYKVGKRFNKLKDAKSFMEHTEEANFIKWYKALKKTKGQQIMIKCICNTCVHCINYNGVKRCNKRSFMINPKFICAWGCNDYKCKYESLLKGQ